jgi:superfamily I DNA/RNA helicase
MIDEGHDFAPEWLRLVTQMIDPNTNSLLLLYDDAQSIYGEKVKRKFSFSSVGIQAKGRTTILRLNYRNTAQVLAVAYEFAKEFMTPAEAEEDDVPLVRPESGGRIGPLPTLSQLPTLKAEADYLRKNFVRSTKMAALGGTWQYFTDLVSLGKKCRTV